MRETLIRFLREKSKLTKGEEKKNTLQVCRLRCSQMSEIVSIMTRKDVMLPVLLLVPGQACAVLRVEGGAAHLKVFDATVGLKRSFSFDPKSFDRHNVFQKETTYVKTSKFCSSSFQ